MEARLSGPRQFGRRRGAHFATLDEQRKEAVAYKEKLVTEAESIAGSTEWTPTANRYKSLMSQWKAAARASKDVDEALWQRFRTAQDTFFTRRTAALEEREAEFRSTSRPKRRCSPRPKRSIRPPICLLRKQNCATFKRVGRRPVGPRVKSALISIAVSTQLPSASDGVRRSMARDVTVDVAAGDRLRESVEKLEKKIARAKQAGKAAEVSDLETQLATQREWLAQSEHPAR